MAFVWSIFSLVLLAISEFLAYAFDRSVGDLAFLLASVACTSIAIAVGLKFQSLMLGILVAFLFASASLTANAHFALFVRDEVFGLAEEFGNSDLQGIAFYLVAAPLALLSIPGVFIARAMKKK